MSKTQTPTINGIRILKKGVKDASGKYSPVQYHIGSRYETNDHSRTYRAAVIYARNYTGLPAALFPQNNSDSRTDYFEKDKAVFREGTPEFDIIASVIAA